MSWDTPGSYPAGGIDVAVTDLFRDGLGRNLARVDAGFNMRGVCLVEGMQLDERTKQ